MNGVSFFEISGRIYRTSTPSSSSSPSTFRGAPTTTSVAQVQGQRNNKGSGGPERAPAMTPVERHLLNPDRWDSTPEKIAKARREYGYGGKDGTPRFKGYFG
jgi:hypothetical protein